MITGNWQNFLHRGFLLPSCRLCCCNFFHSMLYCNGLRRLHIASYALSLLLHSLRVCTVQLYPFPPGPKQQCHNSSSGSLQWCSPTSYCVVCLASSLFSSFHSMLHCNCVHQLHIATYAYAAVYAIAQTLSLHCAVQFLPFSPIPKQQCLVQQSQWCLPTSYCVLRFAASCDRNLTTYCNALLLQ